jgi:membrane protein DedA with SNARE-associated domain
VNGSDAALAEMAEIWSEWGHLAYVGAFIWSFFEGETFVLVAAALGHATGLVNPWVLMFTVWFGSFLGDQCWFLLGRRYGVRIVRRIPRAEAKVARAVDFVERYGAVFILSFRFAYGIRNVASVACGMTRMSHVYFAALNFIAAGIWAASFVAAGWFLAAIFGAERIGWVLGGIGLFVIGGMIYRARTARKPAAPDPSPST